MGILTGKKVLLIAPDYHNYNLNIAAAYKNLGAEVTSFSQDPDTVLFTNFYLSRLERFSLFKKLYRYEVNKKNKKILSSIKRKDFDHVVVIKGDLLSDDTLSQLKNSLPNANFVLFQWDSIKYYNYLHRIKYFNSVFSFDYADCIQNNQIKYLPLFYSPEYEKIASLTNIKYEHDLFFLGFNHTIRVKIIHEMIRFFEEKELRYSINLMTTISEKIQLMKKNSKINCFFKSLNFNQFSDKYSKSKAIIDISPPHQTGLPMRIIEAVGANKKIVTTNSNIINETFYDPKMIFIWGKDNPEDLINFLNQQHKQSNRENYSINSFALNLVRNY